MFRWGEWISLHTHTQKVNIGACCNNNKRRNRLFGSPTPPSMSERIRRRLTRTEGEVDTAELLQRLARARLSSEDEETASNQADDADTDTSNVLGIKSQQRDQQSTTALLNTDIRGSMNSKMDVSESTMLINGIVPITPERRPISGSSLDFVTGIDEEKEEEEDDDNSIRDYSKRDGENHKLPRFEIDLDHFNYLLTKLPSTVTIMHFKNILSGYIHSLRAHNVDLSSDAFIITIFNQLSHDDFNLRHSPKMLKIIEVFLENPANEAMKLANFVYFHRIHYKKKTLFKLWLIKFRKFKEIKRSAKVWDRYLLKKHFNKWTLKNDIYQNDLVLNALIFNDTKISMKFYEGWKFKFNKIQNLNEIVRLHQESKYFNRWTEKTNEDYKLADEFHERRLLYDSWNLWKLKTKSLDFDLVKLRMFVLKWKSQYQKIQLLEDESKILELVLHGGYIFAKWRNLASATMRKEKELMKKHEQHVLRRFVDVWKQSHVLKKIENRVIISRNQFLKGFFLKFLQTRKLETDLLYHFQFEESKKIKRNLLNQWKERIEMNQKVENYVKANTVQKWFKIWKLQTLQRGFKENSRFDLLRVSDMFDTWSREFKLRIRLKEHQRSITKKALHDWKSKVQQHEESLELSIEANKAFIQSRYLQRWKRQQSFIKSELTNKLSFFQKKKAFLKLRAKFYEISKMNTAANGFYVNHCSISVIDRHFKHWFFKYEHSLNIRLSNKLEIFKVEKGLDIRKAFFNKWKKRTDSYSKQLKLFNDNFLRGLTLPKYFDILKSRFEYIKDMEIQADEVNSSNLLSSGFNKLQLKLIYLKELKHLLNAHTQDGDLKLILKILNLWSLRLLKQKRDNENIKSFRDRWNRAHLRAILLLWKGKLIDLKQEDYEFEEIGYSPAIFKPNGLTEQITKTPTKSIVDSSNIFNDNAGGISSIPGSEKIKRQRYEALKSRYSQVKYAIPSPLKFDPPVQPVPFKTESSVPWSNSSYKYHDTNANMTHFLGSTSSKKFKFSPNMAAAKPNNFKESLINNNKSSIIDHDEACENEEGDGYDEPISSPIISRQNLIRHGSRNIKHRTELI